MYTMEKNSVVIRPGTITYAEFCSESFPVVRVERESVAASVGQEFSLLRESKTTIDAPTPEEAAEKFALHRYEAGDIEYAYMETVLVYVCCKSKLKAGVFEVDFKMTAKATIYNRFEAREGGAADG